MEVEGVLWATMLEVRRLNTIGAATHVTDTPGSVAFLTARSHLIGLTINT